MELVGYVGEELTVWAGLAHYVLAFEGYLEGEVRLGAFGLEGAQLGGRDQLHLLVGTGNYSFVFLLCG